MIGPSKVKLDRERLVKVLQQTRDESDATAVAAVRAANRMLDAAGITWSGLLPGSGVRVKVSGPAPSFVFDVPQMPLKEAIEVIEGADDASADAIDIVEIYRGTGVITNAERGVLYREVARVLRKRGDV